MSENINIRLRHLAHWALVGPTIKPTEYDIKVVGQVLGQPPTDKQAVLGALEHLLRVLSDVRGQVWRMTQDLRRELGLPYKNADGSDGANPSGR